MTPGISNAEHQIGPETLSVLCDCEESFTWQQVAHRITERLRLGQLRNTLFRSVRVL